jgi:hypothetical protein
MKRWFPLCVLSFACVAAASAATVQEVYAAGVRASLSGDDVQARKLFVQVLAADPGNKAAAANIRRIDMAAAKTGGGLKQRVDAITVAKVNFSDTSLTAVLDYLPKLATEEPGAPPLNIVRMFPKEYGDQKKITLQLSGVPMSTLLEYIAQLGGVKVSYEKAAVVVKLPDTVQPAPAAQ